jgi:nucleotide-binding universal stress UspA family protein
MADPVVLVALDGADPAPGALPVARRLAELTNTDVRILRLAGAAGPAPADLSGAQLIVMCAPAADIGASDAIDGATLAVLRGAPCPVVLVDPARARDGWTLRRVLAPHDGSPAVSAALGPGIELARAAGAELVVLQVAHEARALEIGSIAPPAYVDQVQHSWPAWSEEFLQRLALVCPLADVRVRLCVRHGEPADEAIRVAAEESADLIVLAWRGGWEAPHARVLKAVLREAPCPVMVTRVLAT